MILITKEALKDPLKRILVGDYLHYIAERRSGTQHGKYTRNLIKAIEKVLTEEGSPDLYDDDDDLSLDMEIVESGCGGKGFKARSIETTLHAIDKIKDISKDVGKSPKVKKDAALEEKLDSLISVVTEISTLMKNKEMKNNRKPRSNKNW